MDELQEAMNEIRRLDFASLASRQTHHGQAGITARFCQLEPQAVEAAKTQKSQLWQQGKQHRVWLPQRCLNCWWTWLHIAPTDSGLKRTLDLTPWTGMPQDMLDSHTLEGKVSNRGATMLSGHYSKHLALSRLVEAHGWEWVREEVHSAPKARSRGFDEQADLFR